MDFQRIAWTDPNPPSERALRSQLESEGYDVRRWRDPSDRVYAAHRHELDESLWVLHGRIVFRVEGDEVALEPGDRLLLPGGTVHSAKAGPDGATYLIGQRRDVPPGTRVSDARAAGPDRDGAGGPSAARSYDRARWSPLG